MVGVSKGRFLDLVRFERAARGLDPGNRLILAERHTDALAKAQAYPEAPSKETMGLAEAHPLVRQLALSPSEILDLIAGARRLKMAVRGFVAEEHLRNALADVPGITHCERLDEEGGPDLCASFRDGPLLTIECKNVAPDKDKHGHPKLDFQRTRAAKRDPCSRYYEPTDFDIVAACLRAVTSHWDFRYALASTLPPHLKCLGRIRSNIKVDEHWISGADEIFRRAYAVKGIFK